MSQSTNNSSDPIHVDVAIVGAGVTGLYQLYRANEAGFNTVLLEAGDGVGGTWFWNRYPLARFDSESYTYGYLFSKELYEEWQWSEHFAGQPEIERYLNHFTDRFDLRRHIRFGAKVTSAVFDEDSGTYTVQASDGSVHIARFLIAATGVLSVPYYPNVPGRQDFAGESYHTGLWPKKPVDFRGKRVAVIGTGASGVQIIPAIADEVASLTVYQRSANWCAPLNNRPITPEEQRELRANYETIRRTCETNHTGFYHEEPSRVSTEDSREQRLAFFERIWNSQGFRKITANYADFFTNLEVRREFTEFVADKIRGIVKDPETAQKLIPTDHLYSQKRPPFVTGYYETYNKPHVSLVSLLETPILRVTQTGIETQQGLKEFDIIVWATGFDFSSAPQRMGIRGRAGRRLEDYWKDGPVTYLGIHCAEFPNVFFPGGPHGAAANVPRYTSDQVDFVTDLLIYMRDNDYTLIEPSKPAENEWTGMVDTLAPSYSPFVAEVSYFFGSNIPGKPKKYLLNPGGRHTLFEFMAKDRAEPSKAFHLSQASSTRRS